jgi:hypothetical protein
MRAKNELKFIAEAYNTKLILERVVDGKLMCPDACCGAPVVECTCGPDCPHCNCFMIHKAMKSKGFTDKLLKEFYKMRDPDGDGSWPDDDDRSYHPDREEPEYDDRGTGEIGREDNEEPKRGITGLNPKRSPKLHSMKSHAIDEIDLNKWREYPAEDVMKAVYRRYGKELPSVDSYDWAITWDKKVRPWLKEHEGTF